jgi:telomere length regulation protein
VAVKWAAALLRECDVRRHGVDLFGRDSFVLGRLIITLGSFLEAAGRSPEAVPLAAAVIELVKAKQVHGSEEPYVRRAALMAAVQALTAIPPALVASSLMSASGGREVTRRIESTQVGGLLEWLREWIASVEEGDPDENCRKMATACQKLHGALASEALAALSESAIEHGLQPTEFMLPGGGGATIDVRLPGIQSLRLS